MADLGMAWEGNVNELTIGNSQAGASTGANNNISGGYSSKMGTFDKVLMFGGICVAIWLWRKK